MGSDERGDAGAGQEPLLKFYLPAREPVQYCNAVNLSSEKPPETDGEIRIVEASEWYGDPPNQEKESSDGNSN